MTPLKIVSTAAVALMMTAGIAAAQTTTYPTGTNTTTGTATTSSTPGTPNTGAGGNTAENVLLLGSSALVALAGGGYLLTRKTRVG